MSAVEDLSPFEGDSGGEYDDYNEYDEYDEYNEQESNEYEDEESEIDEEEDDLMEEDDFETLDSHKHYTSLEKTTSGVPIERFEFIPLNYEDIQAEIEKKAKKLDNMLRIGWENCLILLLKFDNNEHKLMDKFLNTDRELFLLSNGIALIKPTDKSHIQIETDPNFLCQICYCGPGENDPMPVFSLAACSHKFCIDCYTHYVQAENSESKILIKCPFSDPLCRFNMTVAELTELSDYVERAASDERRKNSIDKETKGTNFLTEEQVKAMFQHEPDSDESEEEIDEANKRLEEETMVFNYQLEMLNKEKEERTVNINKTLLSKYMFNLTKFYTQSNSKNIKGCVYPDCDGMVQFVGIQSALTLQEMKQKMIIPTVQCIHKHKFCYLCSAEMDHRPCPCEFIDKWRRKCKDDSETYNWISCHTKFCPQCNNSIEKNGGCNHMTCSQCRHQFCWVCMGNWSLHRDNYNCNLYKGDDEEVKEKSAITKKLLEKYLFYYERFENQRISNEKDKKLLAEFEARILLLQKSMDISYIDTKFYRECIDTLLMARTNLMWTYAFMYYLQNSPGKSLMETALWKFSNCIEEMSHLFEHTKAKNVMKEKDKFLHLKGQILFMLPKFLDMSLDLILTGKLQFVDKTYW